MSTTTPRGWSIGVWVVSALLTLLFLFAGVTKLANGQMAAEQWAQIGYPHWFMLFIGAWEVAGGILLLIPRASLLAAVMLAINMIGAVYTTAIRMGEPRMGIFPFVVLLVLLVVAYVRRPVAAGRRLAA